MFLQGQPLGKEGALPDSHIPVCLTLTLPAPGLWAMGRASSAPASGEQAQVYPFSSVSLMRLHPISVPKELTGAEACLTSLPPLLSVP